jgi:arsenite methyltransferase
VVGVDSSPQMLAVAARRTEQRPNVAFHEADATSLPVEDGGFDAVLSVQVIEYVEDADRALAEIHRVLRPGGRTVVWDVDWTTVSWHSTDQARMERALRAWDEHLAHPALPRTLPPGSAPPASRTSPPRAMSSLRRGSSQTPMSGRSSRSWSSFVAERSGPAEGKAWADDQRDLDARGGFFFSCTQFCFTAKRPGQ